MGRKLTKDKEIKINNYAKVKIPKNFKLIKISSFNVDLRNTINLNNKINAIISYISSNYKNKLIDIIGLQGFCDNVSLYVFISEFKKYCINNNLKFFLAPSFNHIKPSKTDSIIIPSKKMINSYFRSTEYKNIINCDNKSNNSKRNAKSKQHKIIHNIIISKFPIMNIMYSELDDKTDMDDILGIRTVIGVNVLINNKIVSIYNVTLSKDIGSANISNSHVRTTELDTLGDIIKKNVEYITKKKFNKYNKSNIHLILGAMNINEINDDEIDDEYIDLIKNRNYIDIFRHLNSNALGHTTIFMERSNYVLIYLANDIHNVKKFAYKNFMDNKSESKLINILFKRYDIYFFDNYVVKNENDDDTSIIHYPIECIFMMKI